MGVRSAQLVELSAHLGKQPARLVEQSVQLVEQSAQLMETVCAVSNSVSNLDFYAQSTKMVISGRNIFHILNAISAK